jgi:4-amino-4-deoxy-L-arabinose transferase-like glycosyltransferase
MNILNYTALETKKSHGGNRINIYLVLTLLLIIFHFICNLIWIYLNKIPPSWDASLHTRLSIQFLDYIKDNLFHFNLIDFIKISQYYPPFIHLMGMFFALLGNNDYHILQLTGSFFLSINIFFIYLVSKEIFHDTKIGFFSTFFFSFFITIYQQSRVHMLDVPLSAMVTVGLFFLLKSDHFRNRNNSLIFFLVLSLSFLTKWYSLIYLLIPLLYISSELITNKTYLKTALNNILIGCFIFLVVVLPWYMVNLPATISIAQKTITPEKGNPQMLLSFNNLFFYLKLIIMFQISLAGFIFFLFSLSSLVKRKQSKQVIFFLIFHILFIYLFFTFFVGNKNIRYLIPLMPYLAIIMGAGLGNFLKNQKSFSTVLSAFIVIYMLASFFILSFGIPVYPKYKQTLNFPLLGWLDIYYLHYYPVRAIHYDNSFPYDKLIGDVFGSKSGKINWLVLVDTEDFNLGTFDPYLYQSVQLRKNDLQFIGYDLLEDKISDQEMRQYLKNNADLILVAKKHPGLPDYIREYSSLIRFQQFILSGKAIDFVPVAEYQIKGIEFYPADTLILYKKIQSP